MNLTYSGVFITVGNIALLIINTADTLNLDVIAEGVETHAQKTFLLENDCILMQGYHFSKPLS